MQFYSIIMAHLSTLLSVGVSAICEELWLNFTAIYTEKWKKNHVKIILVGLWARLRNIEYSEQGLGWVFLCGIDANIIIFSRPQAYPDTGNKCILYNIVVECMWFQSKILILVTNQSSVCVVFIANRFIQILTPAFVKTCCHCIDFIKKNGVFSTEKQ